ncbi:hypothetical protein [Neobacillus niacini]|uniref:hypothetical protein n=1 Tax=Neobacillus niacini TaxID=86668 RepID=UPI00203D768F|nr:hypothetical protein [Neobacillus niacini]MCM3692179.1 hypothetical protein [Neobacillus niacini]
MDLLGLFEEINNQLVNGISTIMRYVFPLSFTIYFFLYKEKKDIAYSLLHFTFSFRYFFYIVFSILLILFPYLQFLPVINYKYTPITVFILWLLSVGFSYDKVLRSINIKYTFSENTTRIKKVKNRLKLKVESKKIRIHDRNGDEITQFLRYIKKKNISNCFFKLTILVESNFQILFSKVKYNLPIDFSNNNQEFSSSIVDINNEIADLFNYDNEFYKMYSKEYFKFYRLILKEHVQLVSQCLSLNSLKDLNEVIKNLTNLVPPINSLYSKEFYNEFYKTVFDSLTLLSDKQHHYAVSILRNMNILENDSDQIYRQEDLMALIYSLLIVSVEKNNVKSLTDVANIAFTMQERNNRQIKAPNGGISFNFNKLKEKLQNQDNDEKLIYLFILCMIKAIELGHYACVGYLIKVSIQNFDNKSLNAAFIKLRQFNKPYVLNPDDPWLKVNYDIVKEINVNFNFSDVSYFYCLEKVATLVYLQQLFLKKIGNTKELIDFEIISIREIIGNESKFNYFKLKLKGLNKEYGMICLKDDEFKDEIKYPNPSSDMYKYVKI